MGMGFLEKRIRFINNRPCVYSHVMFHSRLPGWELEPRCEARACFQPQRVRCLLPHQHPGFSFSAHHPVGWGLSDLLRNWWRGFYFRLRYSFNTRVCSEPQSLEVAMLLLRAENLLIHFVLREIPLPKTKTTCFTKCWLVISSSSEPSGQWLLCEISLWKIKVKHVDECWLVLTSSW